MTRRLLPHKKSLPWLTLALVIFISAGQYFGWFNMPEQVAQTSQPGLYRVVKFFDGDTIAVNMNGHIEKIRFIGVDTPETHDPRKPVQCGGPNAAAYTKKTIGHQKVRLVSDILSDNRDRYDRLLRYVYLPDGTLLNDQLIKTGHGFAYTYFPFSKSVQFIKDERSARHNHRGLWGYCHPKPNKYGGYTSPPLSNKN